MGNEYFAVTIICIVVVALLLILFFYNSLNIISWINAWISSNKEEKVGLTRLKGHYNANGYLVHSDSDIQLDWRSGTFKRFDSIDRDFKTSIATTSLTNWQSSIDEPDIIPPQPLRPAPVPTTISQPSFTTDVDEDPEQDEKLKETKPKYMWENLPIESTSISPIPRPVSSVNMATLASQSSFPVSLDPPPTPSTRNVSRTQSAPLKLSAIQQQSPTFSDLKDKSADNPVSLDEPEVVPDSIKRALSCDSVCSDTSVALGDLEGFNITGYLCIGLEYDSESWDFIVNVLEAKDLTGVIKVNGFMDTYVRVSLLPDKEATIQTKVYRSTSSPSYKERFLFSLNPREQMQRALCFHLYATDLQSHTLIGEGELRLSDVSLRQPVTTWVTLTDTGQKGTEFGEIMFSLSYLPTAERLTVVVVKARNLKFQLPSSMEVFVKFNALIQQITPPQHHYISSAAPLTIDITMSKTSVESRAKQMIQVYLMQQNKKINKKKTSIKRGERCPIFNEAMMFSVPAHSLNTIQMRLTVAEIPTEENVKATPIGHVIVGGQASGRSLSHWNQMLATLRKPVAMWHTLRR